ncbi:signal peptide peptidase SppA [Bacteriovoracaceae bacterium]|nr:signal peptide peptidase SppA [Bacteriovoracaceae bacterium]
MIFAFVTVTTLKKSSTSSSSIFSDTSPIVVVEVNGAIMTAKSAVERLLKAEKDKNVKAIIVRVNSPGGAVGPTQEIYEEIRRIDKKIPVYASFGSIAASGGYYIGAATRKIFSNAGTLTGSIGVIMNFMNLEKLYQFVKIKPNIIKAGKYKDIGTPGREMRPVERLLMTKMIEGVHKQFIADILKIRKGKIKGDINDHAQGQIYSGEEALKLGLVDELAGLWEAGRRIHKELKLKGDFELRYIKKEKSFKFSSFLSKIEQSMTDLKLQMNSSGLPLFKLDL